MDDKTFYSLALRHPNLNAFGALCQCHHETRYQGQPWNSALFKMANNAAGIKRGSGWAGPVVMIQTWEEDASGKRTVQAAFRQYASVDSFLDDYEAKITRMYPLCVQRRANFWGYMDGLLNGPYKWATDKAYMYRLAETAVRLAPGVFGTDAAAAKLRTALDYAIDNKLITEENARIAAEVIGYKKAAAPSSKSTAVRKKICIDPGHGGKDPGACAGGVAEKDITLKMARLVGESLKGFADVCYTRNGDTFPSLADRCALANSLPAALFVSIHCNSAVNPQANGWEIWTSRGQTKSDPVATKIYNAVKAAFPAARFRTDTGDGDPDKESGFYVLRNTAMPAVLMEIGFISNSADRANLISAEWQRKMAQAIAAAIKEAV